MLNTKTLTAKTIKECRSTEKWLAKFVKKHAPNADFACDEIRVNDAEDDEYIFCEVVLAIGGKAQHKFNFYAGPEDATLVERIGGRKGQVAMGDRMGKYFEMHFSMPSRDDTGKLEAYLEDLSV